MQTWGGWWGGGGGGHFNDQGTGSEDPIGASGISMKSLKEDKNGSVDNADLKPEEKKTLKGKKSMY